MRSAAPWRWTETVHAILLTLSGLGLFGSLIPAFFVIVAPDESAWWLRGWWLLLPLLMVALIAASAAMARRSRPIAAMAIVTPAAMPGLAVVYLLLAMAVA